MKFKVRIRLFYSPNTIWDGKDIKYIIQYKSGLFWKTLNRWIPKPFHCWNPVLLKLSPAEELAKTFKSLDHIRNYYNEERKKKQKITIKSQISFHTKTII